MEEILFSFLWFVARFFSPMNFFITKEVSAKYWCYSQQLTFFSLARAREIRRRMNGAGSASKVS